MQITQLKLKHKRENLTAVDGATLELDWSHSHDEILPEGTPIAFMLTGVTGNRLESSKSIIILIIILMI